MNAIELEFEGKELGGNCFLYYANLWNYAGLAVEH